MPTEDRRPVCGVGVVVIDTGRILLVQRGRPPGEGLWAVPGGKVKLGESMRETARREALEETGLDLEIGAVVWAGDSIGPGEPPEWHFCLTDFLGAVVGGELRAGDDAVAVRWVPLTEVRSLPLTPTMHSLLEALSE
jgi:8-oxo-dGTP diphosphatase